MSSFLKFMSDRQNMIDRGLLGYNREQYVKQQKPETVQTYSMIGREQQRANKSDPYTYERTVSHLRNGTAMPADYHVVWGQGEAISPIGLALGKEVKIAIMVPHKRQVPCN